MSITGTKPLSSHGLGTDQNSRTDYIRALGDNSNRQEIPDHSSLSNRPHRSKPISSPPKPTYTDTSVNVATAFYQAAAAQMAPSSWNTLRATNRTGRGSASEQEKENHQRYTTQRPSSKADSIALVSDSEPEGEVDAKGRPLSKGSNSGIRSQISRALSPAAYYVRERSRDPEESNQSLHIPRSFSRESSYDYTTEQAHYEAQLAKAKARRASQEPPDSSIEASFEGAASKSNNKKHRSRISLDNQAWKPGKDDFDEDEDYDSSSGKKRRRKKKKEEGAGRLTNLPTVNYGKKRKGRKSGAGPETIEEVDETSFGNETSEMVTEDFIFPTPPEQPSFLDDSLEKSIPIKDPSVTSFPPPKEEVHIRTRSRSRSRSVPPESVRSRRPTFGPGAFLASVLRFSTITIFRTIAFLWQVMVFLVKTPLGILLLLGIAGCALYYFDAPIPPLPSISLPSNPLSWPVRPIYHAPSIPASTVEELISRLTKAESALDELSSKYKQTQVNLDTELRTVHTQAERIALLEDRLNGEIKHTAESLDATRQATGQGLHALRGDIASLQEQIAKKPSGNPETDAQLLTTLQTLESRVDLAESSVKDVLEYVKSGARLGSRTGNKKMVIKTSDGKDVSSVIAELVDDALALFTQDTIGKADFALYSAGGRILPSLTTPSYEITPSSWFSYVIGWPFGRGFATGLPPVTALHPDLNLGRCWSFAGSQGQLAVVLARSVHISEITVDHARPAFDERSAPKRIAAWGFVEGADNLEKYNAYRQARKEHHAQEVLDGRIPEPEPVLAGTPRGVPYLHLATVTYDVHASSHIQTFKIPQEIQDLSIDMGVVLFEILENWGDEQYTCVYRVRVHGTEKDGRPPLLPETEE